jgi:hypothetical protein
MKLFTPLIAVALLAASPPHPFALVRLIDDVPPSTVIGRIKEGMICGPGKALRWQDIAKGPVSRLTMRADALLAGEPMPADDPFGEQAKACEGARYKLAATVTGARLSICVAALSLIKQKPKGEGEIDVRVATFDEQTHQRLPDRSFTVQLDCAGRDPRTDDRVYESAILEALRRTADALKAG